MTKRISTLVEEICTCLCREICDTTIGGQNVHVLVRGGVPVRAHGREHGQGQGHGHGHGHGNDAFYIFISFDNISIRHYVSFGIYYFRPYVLSSLQYLPYDVLSHSVFITFDLLSHLTFCPSTFFTFGVFYFDMLSVNDIYEVGLVQLNWEYVMLSRQHPTPGSISAAPLLRFKTRVYDVFAG